MPSRRTYVLDANIFIEANRRYYSFQLCPAFWTTLLSHHASGRLCSIDKVWQELSDGGDALTEWANSVPNTFFASTDDSRVTGCFTRLVVWVQSQDQFFPEAKAQFASGVDGWLIACAKANDMAVVTHE